MSFKSIFERIEDLTIEEILSDSFALEIRNVETSNSVIRLYSKKISDFRNLDVTTVLKYIMVFAINEPDMAIDIARKKGVFRYKSWGLEDNKALFLLKKLKECRKLLFSEATLKYIESKIEISWFFEFYKESENKLVNFIKEHYKNRHRVIENGVLFEEALFKELLAYDDMLFISNQSLNTSNNKDKLYSYSHEQISESISYLIYLCDTNINFSYPFIPIVIPEFVTSNAIEGIILLGCKVCKIQEWEAFIDYFPYCIKRNDRTYTIFAENPIYDKSMRLGYVNSILQSQLSIDRGDEMFSEVLELSELSRVFDCDAINFVEEIGTGKLSRYRISIPELLLEKGFESKNSFYKEELIEIQRFSKDFNIPGMEALNKKITKNCTLKDVILFKRFFAIFNYVAGYQLLSQKNSKKIISSLLPSFSRKNLISTVGKIIGSSLKAEELITLFTYNKKYKLDLQYTPLLSYSEYIMMPLFLTVKSNFLRNCIAQSYIVKNQIVNQEDKEYLVLRLKETLENNHPNFKVFTNKKFKYNNRNGEVDVILITDDSLYLFECKAPLEPTSNFELRSTNDHICKAANQLTYSSQAFADEEFRKPFLKCLGVEEKARTVYTCIVMGNRIFNGYMALSHPIRYIGELDMIVNNGIIRSNIGEWSCWNNSTFSEKNLIDFISPDDKLHKANFDAMVEYKEYMHIKGKKIELSTYVFDTYQAVLNYDKCFSIVSRDNEKFNNIKQNIENSRSKK